MPRDDPGKHLRLLQDADLGRKGRSRDRGGRTQGIQSTVMTHLDIATYFSGWMADWPQLARLDSTVGSRRQSGRPAKPRGRRAGPSLGHIRDSALFPTPRRGAIAGQVPTAVLESRSGSDLPEQRAAVPADSDPSGRTPPKFERRFRAVLVADVVGYTRLMEAAELETHARYRTLRVGVGDPTIASHRGAIVKNTGDGFIAVFESSFDALGCAIELQREMAAHESARVPERRIAFRIGIHWEPVIFDLNDVYGGGVNLAVRLQSIAPPGGVVVSSAVLDAAGDIGDLPVEDLGHVRLKNLTQTVHAFSLRLPTLDRGGGRGISVRAPGWLKLPAIAVLPFRTITGAAEHAVLGDWLAEEASRSLSRSNLLAVISHWSSRSLSTHPVDMTTIRSSLGVDYCVSGTLRVVSDEIVLDADLLDTMSGRILWTRQFTGPMGKYLSASAEGVSEIVSAVGHAIADDAIAHLSERQLSELEEHRLLLAAVGLMNRRSLRDFRQSRELIEELLRRTPHAAEAHAWHGKWHVFSVFNAWSDDPAKDTQKAIDCAARAVDINPESTFALTIDGFVHNNLLRRMDIAATRYDEALRRNPNEPLAWLLKGALHAFRDESDEAVVAAEKARRLSPIDPFQYFYQTISATALLSAERYEEALAFADSSLQLNDWHVSTLRAKIIALHYLERPAEARAAAAEVLRRQPDFNVDGYLRAHPAAGSEIGRKAATALRAAGIP
ncbi:MAG: adenylate/guanylate cyclase domain-containing protein [Xanthobacteraceae bacterium]